MESPWHISIVLQLSCKAKLKHSWGMLREKIRMTGRMYHVRPQRSIYVTSTTTIFQQVGWMPDSIWGQFGRMCNYQFGEDSKTSICGIIAVTIIPLSEHCSHVCVAIWEIHWSEVLCQAALVIPFVMHLAPHYSSRKYISMLWAHLSLAAECQRHTPISLILPFTRRTLLWTLGTWSCSMPVIYSHCF